MRKLHQIIIIRQLWGQPGVFCVAKLAVFVSFLRHFAGQFANRGEGTHLSCDFSHNMCCVWVIIIFMPVFAPFLLHFDNCRGNRWGFMGFIGTIGAYGLSTSMIIIYSLFLTIIITILVSKPYQNPIYPTTTHQPISSTITTLNNHYQPKTTTIIN